MDPWPSKRFPEILNQFLTQESRKSAKNSWSYKHLKFKFVRKLKPEYTEYTQSIDRQYKQSIKTVYTEYTQPRNGIFGKSPIGHRFCCFSIVSGRTKWDSNRFSKA